MAAWTPPGAGRARPGPGAGVVWAESTGLRATSQLFAGVDVEGFGQAKPSQASGLLAVTSHSNPVLNNTVGSYRGRFTSD